jgi:hypothetical protein
MIASLKVRFVRSICPLVYGSAVWSGDDRCCSEIEPHFRVQQIHSRIVERVDASSLDYQGCQSALNNLLFRADAQLMGALTDFPPLRREGGRLFAAIALQWWLFLEMASTLPQDCRELIWE